MKVKMNNQTLNDCTILIVDDEADLLRGVQRTLAMELACRVLTAGSGAQALALMAKEDVDLVLTDVRMPEMDGLTLLEEIKAREPTVLVVVMTAFGTIEKAVDAIKAGAYDFVQKPFDEERLLHVLKKGLQLNRLVRENARLMRKLREKKPFETLVGRSQPMERIMSTIQMLAQSDVTALILGETGTGKDLAARLIHETGERADKPFVTVNCPAVPDNLLESELFGHRKGAFTDATADKAGLFDRADGGTLFLDEIGDLSLPMQTKLLRVLEDKQVMPLGEGQSHAVDVRIIAATNQDLEARMQSNQFREDLYYRLRVATVTMPPLRDITEDIPLLVDHFLHKVADEQNQTPKKISPEVLKSIMARKWTGNIRELENTIRGWNALMPGPIITVRHLSGAEGNTPVLAEENLFSRPYKELKSEAIDEFTLDYLCRLLEHTRGNVTLSAEISGIKRQSLQKIIKRYDVPVEKYRG
jgi:DNA-binding NtrC family response regulator